jgi:APA family basic amino acid/polyamine antiporter
MNVKKGKLGLWMLIALVTGNMVGSGAFLLPADLARIGSISLVSLVFTVVGALALAMVFARMSLLIPRSGGPYVYAQAAFGEYMGLQTAYYYWVGVWVGNAAIVVAALGYIDALFPILHNSQMKIAMILLVIWLPTLINILGIRLAGAVQIITAILKFTPLIIIGAFGWFYFHPEYLSATFNVTEQSNFTAFSSAVILTLWLFVGVESATVPADSVDNPKRNIPLATLIGTAFAALIYIASNTAIFGMIDTATLANSTAPFAKAMEIIVGPWGRTFVAFGAICACLGALNGWILIAAQIPMAAAKEGIFPKIFDRCNSQGAPTVGLIVTSCCITLLILASTYLNLIEQFEMLILAATTAEVLSYFYTSMAQITLLPKGANSKKERGQLLVAIVAAAYSFYAILGSTKEVIYALMAFILLTIPLYAIFRKKNGVSKYENR